MFSHVMLGSSDIERSRKFYDALLASVGGSPAKQDAKGRLVYAHKGGALMISKPINGEPASGANGGTVGFATDSPEELHKWHQAGVENGGVTAEDPPGMREDSKVYLAYLRDPDGNKLCAIHRPKT